MLTAGSKNKIRGNLTIKLKIVFDNALLSGNSDFTLHMYVHISKLYLHKVLTEA